MIGRRHRLLRLPAAPWAVVVVALGLTVYFDLAAATPFHDEWMYRWTIKHVLATGEFRSWPQLQPLSLVQMATAFPFAALGADPRVFRLTTIPIYLAGIYAIDRIARRMGADAFWAAAAAAAAGCAPLVLQVQTGFLSDGTYFGLLALCLWAGVRWLQSNRGLGWFIALALAAGLQRQVGLLLLVAMLVVAVARRSREWRPLLVLAAALVVGAGGLSLLQHRLGVDSGTMGLLVGQAATRFPLVAGLAIMFGGAPVLGLLFFPLSAALLLGRRRRVGHRAEYLIVGLGLFSVLGAVGLALLLRSGVFPGDTLGPWGLGPIERMNIPGKSSPLPPPGYLLLEACAVLGSLAALVWRARDWLGLPHRGAAAFLVLVAAGQALPMLVVGVGDRYFIPVAVALLPGVAAVVSGGLSGATMERRPRREKLSKLLAVGTLVAGLALYTVGETDYIAWHVARDGAANLARTGIDPTRVDGGDEDFATHILVPYFDQHGALPPYVTNGDALRNPDRVVEFAGRDDPAAGVTYGTWTPGKVVVRCRAEATCPGKGPS